MTVDEMYMQRCLQLASLGLGDVQPNPMVGAVIVKDGQIIGEGYHHKYGGPHAEVNAIDSVKDKGTSQEIDDLCQLGTMLSFWKDTTLCGSYYPYGHTKGCSRNC